MESACSILCGASHSWCDRLSDRFGNGSLDWLAGFTRETNPHLAELRRFGNVGVARRLGVLRLDLERLLSRLGCYQLPKCAGRVLKRLLEVIGALGSNSLEAFIRLTTSADDRIEAFLACPLKLFTGPKLLSHVESLSRGFNAMHNVNCCTAAKSFSVICQGEIDLDQNSRAECRMSLVSRRWCGHRSSRGRAQYTHLAGRPSAFTRENTAQPHLFIKGILGSSMRAKRFTSVVLVWVLVMQSLSACAAEAKYFPVPEGDHPRDVAPAPDGTVWYTGQLTGVIGRLDPKTGGVERIPLGKARLHMA